jgi:hypothetical protein
VAKGRRKHFPSLPADAAGTSLVGDNRENPISVGNVGDRDTMPNTNRWDVFISHASEDTEAVAVPLANALEQAGVRVWLDQKQLKIGDSLRGSIDHGLAKSRFGVLIISASFLNKQWPMMELNGLMAIEEDGRKVILPIWHGVTKPQVAKHSPILADRLAAHTLQGVAHVAAVISDVVFDPKSGSPSGMAPLLGRRFIELLDAGPLASTIRTFLIAHPEIFMQAFVARDPWFEPGKRSQNFDLCVRLREPSTPTESKFLVFLSPSEKLFRARRPTPSLVQYVDSLGRLVQASENSKGFVVIGRRNSLSEIEREQLKQYNASLSGVTVRTYDWLIDLTMHLDHWARDFAMRRDLFKDNYEGFTPPTGLAPGC